MFKKIIFLSVIVYIVFLNNIFLAVTIGSDTAVNRFNTQQILATGDRVASFAALYGGLALTTFTVTATWDSVFSLEGPLNLNSGTLLLDSDLILANNSNFFQAGSITGQNHLLELAATNSFIHTSTATSRNCIISNLEIFLNSDVYLRNCNITFSGNSMINGKGWSLNLLSTATIALASNSTLIFKNIVINGMRVSRLFGSTTTSTFIFDDVTINLDSNYTFSTARFEVCNDLLITGSGFGIQYSTTGASFIGSSGRLIFDQGVTFSYVPSNGSRNLLTFVDSAAELFLRGGIFYTGSGGINLLKGKLSVDRDSYLLNAGVSSAAGITLGDGVALMNNMRLNLLPAATLNLGQGFLVYKNV